MDLSTSPGVGNLSKSGGKTKGFFYQLKIRHLGLIFFPCKASPTEPHEYKNNMRINNLEIFKNLIIYFFIT